MPSPAGESTPLLPPTASSSIDASSAVPKSPQLSKLYSAVPSYRLQQNAATKRVFPRALGALSPARKAAVGGAAAPGGGGGEDHVVSFLNLPVPVSSAAAKKKPEARLWSPSVSSLLRSAPSVSLAVLLNLMLSVPFGSSFFPLRGPAFPCSVPEVLGVRMFLLSTLTAQLVLDSLSGFDGVVGMEMVENTPFMHSMAFSVAESVSRRPLPLGEAAPGTEGCDPRIVPTLLFTFALSTALTSASFYLLGRFNLGNVVYFFPKHVILGCIGGIGVFVTTTGLEVSTGSTFDWNSVSKMRHFFFDAEKSPYLYLLPIGLVLLLRLVLASLKSLKVELPLLPPCYFMSVPPLFYLAIYVLGIPLDTVASNGFLFPQPSAPREPIETGLGCVDAFDVRAIFFPTYSLCQSPSEHSYSPSSSSSSLWPTASLRNPLELVDFPSIVPCLPILFGAVVFSLMHVPINIPSLSMTTKVDVDMNNEMVAHGYSNLLSFVLGGLPNYLCYSNSTAYIRSGGGGRISSLFVVLGTVILFFIGPDLVALIPRCMAGTLLIHVGLDLFLEGVYSSYLSGFETLEYFSIWLIVVAMTLSGMTAGLALGLVLAAVTFVVSSSVHTEPFRGAMPATTLRSSKWRGVAARKILDDRATGRGRILCVQMQGHIFFSNLSVVNRGIELLLGRSSDEAASGAHSPRHAAATAAAAGRKYDYMILDFTLVNGIDSSAVFAISKLCDKLLNSGGKGGLKMLCFVTGNDYGFPCTIDLSAMLLSKGGVVVVRELDKALEACEDDLVALQDPSLASENSVGSLSKPDVDRALLRGRQGEAEVVLSMLAAHSNPGDKISTTGPSAAALLSYFSREELDLGDVLWSQGARGDSCVMLVKGTLRSDLEEEAGTFEVVRQPGTFVGELSLILNEEDGRRLTTVTAVDDCLLYRLSEDNWKRMKREDHQFANLIYMICIRALSNRNQHCSNRFIETRCVPI